MTTYEYLRKEGLWNKRELGVAVANSVYFPQNTTINSNKNRRRLVVCDEHLFSAGDRVEALKHRGL